MRAPTGIAVATVFLWAVSLGSATAVTLGEEPTPADPNIVQYFVLQGTEAKPEFAVSLGPEILFGATADDGNNGPFLPASAVGTTSLGTVESQQQAGNVDGPPENFTNFLSNNADPFSGPSTADSGVNTTEILFDDTNNNPVQALPIGALVAASSIANPSAPEFTAIGVGLNEQGENVGYRFEDLRISVFDTQTNTFTTVASYLAADNNGDGLDINTQGLGNQDTDLIFYINIALLQNLEADDLLVFSATISGADGGRDTFGYIDAFTGVNTRSVIPLPATAWLMIGALMGIVAWRSR
ncbi:MAG: hypothetical protein AAF968_09965 [Pseudomonadota bacterium]